MSEQYLINKTENDFEVEINLLIIKLAHYSLLKEALSKITDKHKDYQELKNSSDLYFHEFISNHKKTLDNNKQNINKTVYKNMLDGFVSAYKILQCLLKKIHSPDNNSSSYDTWFLDLCNSPFSKFSGLLFKMVKEESENGYLCLQNVFDFYGKLQPQGKYSFFLYPVIEDFKKFMKGSDTWLIYHD